MTRLSKWLSVAFGFLAIILGCSQVTEVSTQDLALVVERDGVPFTGQSIPQEVLDRLSHYKLVVIGETHGIREHRELMAELIRNLHSQGFRQLLLEWPQMADWLVTDYVEDGGLVPGWVPPTDLHGDLITAIRDFNRTLAAGERFQVRGIDVNLEDYGGAEGFRNLLEALMQHLSNREPIEAFLRGSYDTPKQQRDALESLRNKLQAGRSDLVASWGERWYGTVAELIDVELASVGIRALREDFYDTSVRMRESVMKRLADLRLGGYAHRTLINVGSTHAQKKYLRGTEQEWLGDYLVHKSAAVGGATIVLAVVAARGESTPGGPVVDRLAESPANEVFRLMTETWPGQSVFLPLDDPIFLGGGVPMNFEGTIYVGSPKQQYDGLLLYPLAHRVPSS
jgi:hypothetical protein